MSFYTSFNSFTYAKKTFKFYAKKVLCCFLWLLGGCVLAYNYKLDPKRVYIIGCKHFDPKLVLDLYSAQAKLVAKSSDGVKVLERFYEHAKELDIVKGISMHMRNLDLFVFIKEKEILARSVDEKAIGKGLVFSHRPKFIKEVLLVENCSKIDLKELELLKQLSPLLSLRTQSGRWDVAIKDPSTSTNSIKYIKLHSDLEYSVAVLKLVCSQAVGSKKVPYDLASYKYLDLRKKGFLVVKN